MAYTVTNFKTKKALKEALAAGKTVRVFSPGPFLMKQDGVVALEGPHFPEPHRWYAEATVAKGVVVSVK